MALGGTPHRLVAWEKGRRGEERAHPQAPGWVAGEVEVP